MIRFLISMAFYVVLARWIYAEMNLVCPSFTPSVDRILSAVQIPTHNNWHENGIKGLVGEATAFIQRARADIEEKQSPIVRSSVEPGEFGARIYRAAVTNENSYSYEEFGKHIRTDASNLRAAPRYSSLKVGGIERF